MLLSGTLFYGSSAYRPLNGTPQLLAFIMVVINKSQLRTKKMYSSYFRRINKRFCLKSLQLLLSNQINRSLQQFTKQITLFMTQEFFFKDEVIEFSHKLDADSFNVKAYRRRRTGKSSRIQPKEQQSHQFVLSELGEELKLGKSMQKTQRTAGELSSKRFSSTAAVRRRSQLSNSNQFSFLNTGKTKLNSVDESVLDRDISGLEKEKGEGEGEKKVGAFSKEAREYAKKGQIKNKHIENWLNQILLEYCHNQEFDLTIENSALKKYGIDKNSLLSKGIKPQNLERIFRSLFVYSMGFNTLLKEVGGKNMNIRKTFWKVFAILLEYCSDGDFETMLAEIERDKVQKMESMRAEIEKRQRVIDSNEDNNQEKNAKIFKELKELRQNNSTLQNDKNVLMEDFKEAEQAFNQEVSLRLKFENKINEIHGVHRELSIKHQRLYDDLSAKLAENALLKDRLAKLTEAHVTAKHELEQERKQHRAVEQESRFNFEQLEDLKRQNLALELRELEGRHKREELAIGIHDGETKVGQLRQELKNLELMLKLKEESQKQLQKEYQRSLHENRQLVNSLQEQLAEINRYMLEKKEFGDTHSKIYAEIEVLNSSLAQRERQTQQLREGHKQLEQQLHENRIELEMSRHKNQHLSASLADYSLKMEEMKKIKNGFEEEVIELRSKEEVYQNYYAEKERAVQELTAKIDELERKCSEFNITKKALESRLAILSQKLLSDEEISRKKQEKSLQEIKALQQDASHYKLEAENKRAEAARYAALYEETFNKLKDQLFERNDLELKYNQSLSVVESENDHIKELNIRISEYQERVEDLGRKMKGLQFVMEGKEKTFRLEIASLNSQLKLLKGQLQQKKAYPHPMAFQDILSELQRDKTKVKDILSQQSEAEKVTRQLLAKVQKLEKDLNANKTACESLAKTLLEEQQRGKQRVKELQQQLRNSRQQRVDVGGKRDEGSFKQKERKYLQFIKEKSSRIEELLKEVQKMHDSNNDLLKRAEEAERRVKQKELALVQLQQEKQHIQAQQETIRAEAISDRKEKEKLISKLADAEDKFYQTLSSQVLVIDPSKRQKEGTIEVKARQQNSSENRNRPGWRNDFANKVKNACNYYKK